MKYSGSDLPGDPPKIRGRGARSALPPGGSLDPPGSECSRLLPRPEFGVFRSFDQPLGRPARGECPPLGETSRGAEAPGEWLRGGEDSSHSPGGAQRPPPRGWGLQPPLRSPQPGGFGGAFASRAVALGGGGLKPLPGGGAQRSAPPLHSVGACAPRSPRGAQWVRFAPGAWLGGLELSRPPVPPSPQWQPPGAERPPGSSGLGIWEK
jgi:hypothetical protein